MEMVSLTTTKWTSLSNNSWCIKSKLAPFNLTVTIKLRHLKKRPTLRCRRRPWKKAERQCRTQWTQTKCRTQARRWSSTRTGRSPWAMRARRESPTRISPSRSRRKGLASCLGSPAARQAATRTLLISPNNTKTWFSVSKKTPKNWVSLLSSTKPRRSNLLSNKTPTFNRSRNWVKMGPNRLHLNNSKTRPCCKNLTNICSSKMVSSNSLTTPNWWTLTRASNSLPSSTTSRLSRRRTRRAVKFRWTKSKSRIRSSQQAIPTEWRSQAVSRTTAWTSSIPTTRSGSSRCSSKCRTTLTTTIRGHPRRGPPPTRWRVPSTARLGSPMSMLLFPRVGQVGPTR